MKPGRFGRLAGAYKTTALIAFTTGLLFVAANVISVPVLMLWPKPPSAVVAKYGQREIESVYPHLNAAEIRQLLDESWSHGIIYEPYVHFREQPRRGKYVNVDEAGFRHSEPQCPWPPDPRHFNLFVFGGSTTFGYGVADNETVPSQLAQRLSAALQTRVCVYNFGRCYYQCTQERILFEQLLVQGHVPRMAIFIDGLNDCYYPDGVPTRDSRIETAMTGRAEAEPSRGFTLPAAALIRRIAKPGPAAQPGAGEVAAGPVDAGDETQASAVSLRYVKNMGLINRIAASYGVETWFVWQPVPTYNYDIRHHPFAAGIGDHWRSKQGYEHLARLRGVLPFPPNFLWCADIQENVRQPLYVDAVHYTREMSERLAAEITSQILARRGTAAAGEPKP